MREIKFRIWDKTNKRMIKNEDILRIYMRFREIDYILAREVFSITFEEADIMQYTGLKDKNGTEIYEGDILQGTYYFRGVGWYDTGEGDVEIKGSVVYENGKYRCQGYDLCDLIGDVEVVGNIYENPELLNN